MCLSCGSRILRNGPERQQQLDGILGQQQTGFPQGDRGNILHVDNNLQPGPVSGRTCSPSRAQTLKTASRPSPHPRAWSHTATGQAAAHRRAPAASSPRRHQKCHFSPLDAISSVRCIQCLAVPFLDRRLRPSALVRQRSRKADPVGPPRPSAQLDRDLLRPRHRCLRVARAPGTVVRSQQGVAVVGPLTHPEDLRGAAASAKDPRRNLFTCGRRDAVSGYLRKIAQNLAAISVLLSDEQAAKHDRCAVTATHNERNPASSCLRKTSSRARSLLGRRDAQ